MRNATRFSFHVRNESLKSVRSYHARRADVSGKRKVGREALPYLKRLMRSRRPRRYLKINFLNIVKRRNERNMMNGHARAETNCMYI